MGIIIISKKISAGNDEDFFNSWHLLLRLTALLFLIAKMTFRKECVVKKSPKNTRRPQGVPHS